MSPEGRIVLSSQTAIYRNERLLCSCSRIEFHHVVFVADNLIWHQDNGVIRLPAAGRVQSVVQIDYLPRIAHQKSLPLKERERTRGHACRTEQAKQPFPIAAYGSYKISDGHAMIAHDAKGHRTWTVSNDERYGPKEPPGSLFSPESLTVLQSGSIAVADVILHTVQLFSPRGRYLKTISLDRSWRRKASYPSHVLAGTHGEFMVHDFMGSPPLIWMNVRGNVLRAVTPRYGNGKAIDNPDMCIANDGSLWVSDSYSLLRIDPNGSVSRRLGEAPRTDQLREIAELVIRADGGILAVDERTNAVHTFDRTGRWLHVCIVRRTGQEAASDFGTGQDQIEVGPNGSFAVSDVWFGADGRRRPEPTGFRSIWKRLKPIRRRPDGTWLESISRKCVAPNGALAIVDGGLLERRDATTHLSLYTAAGLPQRSVLLPASIGQYPTLAYGGERVVLAAAGRVFCYDRSGNALWQFTLPFARASDLAWTPFLTDSGRTLCLFNGERTVYRYAMP